MLIQKKCCLIQMVVCTDPEGRCCLCCCVLGCSVSDRLGGWLLFDPEEILFDPEMVLFDPEEYGCLCCCVLACFCVCCIGNGYCLIQKKYGLIQKKCCCLIQMDGIFFVFFLCLMIFFCIFVLSDLLFFSEICFLW